MMISSEYSQDRPDTHTVSSNGNLIQNTTSASGKCQFDYVETVHIDRPKLEKLRQMESNLQLIMKETDTRIQIDPTNIKILGGAGNAKLCKQKILEILEIQTFKVVLKLDVSYTDHSHIIGKGGSMVKSIMNETGSVIHFPDCNRNSHQDKSNHVYIVGEPEGVEKTRAKIRNLSPLSFSFDLPILYSSQENVPVDLRSYIMDVQKKYSVQVMLKEKSKLNSTTVIIKGCEKDVNLVKEATVCLMNYLLKSKARQTRVQASLEVSPQYHKIVLGKDSVNLRAIMTSTRTEILFKDVRDPNIPNILKNNVRILGNIHDVYLARQKLIGSLPISLMFDLTKDFEDLVGKMSSVNSIMQELGVIINVQRKPKSEVLSVIVKGIERNATKVYEARKRFLGLEEKSVIAVIPADYEAPELLAMRNRNLGNTIWRFESSETNNKAAVLPGSNNSSMILDKVKSNIRSNSSMINSSVNSSILNSSMLSSSNSSINFSLEKESASSNCSVNDTMALDKTITSDYSSMALESSLDLSSESERWKAPGYGRRTVEDIWKYTTGGEDSQEPLFKPPVQDTLSLGPAHEDEEVSKILMDIGLDRYVSLFAQNDINEKVFKTLTDKDLCEIGITGLGARRRILDKVSEMNPYVLPLTSPMYYELLQMQQKVLLQQINSSSINFMNNSKNNNNLYH